MKKASIYLAAALAASGAVFAESAEDKAAQVYDVKVTVKTTAAKKGTLSSSKNAFISGSQQVVYRAQSSRSWIGVIWGCDCDAILGNWNVINKSLGIVAGCVIWEKKVNTVIFDENIKWRLLNAIDATGTKCEGAWTIGDSSDKSNAFLSFAGFGMLDLGEGATDCMGYVKTISGNVAGWMPAPYVTTPGKKGTCTFCTQEADEADITDYATAWAFCPCATFGDSDFTAVSGTWSIKYNKALSKKLKDNTSILNVYKKFPESVKSSISAKINALLALQEAIDAAAAAAAATNQTTTVEATTNQTTTVEATTNQTVQVATQI